MNKPWIILFDSKCNSSSCSFFRARPIDTVDEIFKQIFRVFLFGNTIRRSEERALNFFSAQLSVSIDWKKKQWKSLHYPFKNNPGYPSLNSAIKFPHSSIFPLWKQERFKILLEIQERIGDDYPLITASRVSTYQINIATSVELGLHLRKVAL